MSTAYLSGIKVGDGAPARVMGVINASPESFYKGSVRTREKPLAETVRRMAKEGVDFIDVGAMSTAPYLDTQIDEREEAKRLSWAVRIIRKNTTIPISIDSNRSRPIEAGLEAGGSIINLVVGLQMEPKLPLLAKKAQGLILMAHPSNLSRPPIHPIQDTKKILKESLRFAQDHGVSRSRIVIDPGIGFFRNSRLEWWQWDLAVLRNLRELDSLDRPLLIGVSRKSFISQVLNWKAPEDRLPGSLAATAVAVMNGASIIRTHDVKETKEAVQVAQAILLERISFRSMQERSKAGR